MKIAFAKVGRSPGEFRYCEGGMSLVGTLKKEGHHLAILEGEISGVLKLHCDRCGTEFEEALSLLLELHLTDRPEKVSDNLDTIEFLGGEIDIAEILESELASYRLAYHYCPKCAESEGEIDIEY